MGCWGPWGRHRVLKDAQVAAEAFLLVPEAQAGKELAPHVKILQVCPGGRPPEATGTGWNPGRAGAAAREASENS